MTRIPALLLAAALAACATTPPPPPPPTVPEIARMAQEGQPADAIIRRLQESRAIYTLPASELAKLREQGVPDPVIDYMQQTYLDAVRWQERARAYDAWGYPGFGPYWSRYRWPYGW